MYAHGYVGDGAALSITNPSIRRYLIQNGYAWAASSYSKNNYDVRVGIEDTNALALQFTKIAAANSRTLPAPSKIFIIGHSMGGHIAAAAIEDETYATSNNKVKYNGAVPMCGVMGDTELFNTFAAMQISALSLAGVPNSPLANWSDVRDMVTSALFTTFPSELTSTGVKYSSVLKNLTGGERPLFDLSLAEGVAFSLAYDTFGGDATVNGILNKSILDTNAFTYTITGDTTGSNALNATAQKVTAATDANRLRRDGLRWIPKTNGEFKIPVVTIHTLGDLYVPFSMEQIYQKRVAAKGNSAYLVQRAIRGISHCDFTIAEQVAAFRDMVAWEAGGAKPTGDDIVTPATVAASTYGCTHTKNTLGSDDPAITVYFRGVIAANSTACP
ncbi:MAG: hypothetical protein WA140_12740 [Geobacteraceae bacterium]